MEEFVIRKLDRYVALAFFGPFVLCLLGFAGLYVVIDLFANIDEFEAADSVGATVRQTLLFYALRLPSFLVEVMPMLTALPAVICMVRLERSNELVAMRAAGVSARRAAVPLLACSAIVVVLSALNQEQLVPALHRPLAEIERRARDEGQKPITNTHVVDREGRLLMIGRYQPRQPLPTLTGVTFWWRDERGRTHETRARRAFALEPGDATWYLADDIDLVGRSERRHPDGRFTSAAVADLLRRYDAEPGSERPALMVRESGPNGRQFEFGSYDLGSEVWPVARNVLILEPSKPGSGDATLRGRGRWAIAAMVWAGDHWRVFDAAWYGPAPSRERPGAAPGAPVPGADDLPPGFDPRTGRLVEKRLPDGSALRGTITPDGIRRNEFQQMSASLTLTELADLAARFPSERFRRRCWVTIWNRVALPFSNVVLVLLAVPLVFRRSGRSALVGIALAVAMTVAYLVTNIVAIDLAYRGWPLFRWPAFAGLAPTALFAVLGAWVFARMDEV
jgi:lipopolysaccharide export LptBFGC system permease protein LptF